MRGPFDSRSRKVHPYQWLWEPLESEPRFLLRPMFGGRAVYLDGRLMLYFSAKEEPWRGVLVCTDREHHGLLCAELQALAPHPILPKWLYLPESADGFERLAERLVALVRRRDPRIGVLPQAKRNRTRRKSARPVKATAGGKSRRVRRRARGPSRSDGFRPPG